jgi:hypothetical protein
MYHKYFTKQSEPATMPGQILSKEDMFMPSDFEDPEAALAQLLKDNPKLAPQIAAGLKCAESDVLQLTDNLLSNVDFDDPAKAKQLLANLLTHVSNGKLTTT